MIISKRKAFEEIKESLKNYESVLVAGCGTCVAVCLAGGEKEVGLLASQLAIASKVEGRSLKIGEVTIERQCDKEFLRELKNKAPELVVITDVCLCEYTDHGHCGRERLRIGRWLRNGTGL